jgi:hypothetical protein
MLVADNAAPSPAIRPSRCTETSVCLSTATVPACPGDRGARLAAPSGAKDEETVRRDYFDLGEARSSQRRLEGCRLVEDLPDAKARTVVQISNLNIALRWPVVQGSGLDVLA